MVSYALAFPFIALALRVSKYQTVKEALARLSSGTRQSEVRDGFSAEQVARLVEMASNATVFRPNCLQRSVVLWWALRSEGWDGDITFGVRRSSDDDIFDFHAWVVCDGQIMNDHPDIGGTFIRLGTSTDLPPGVSFK